MKPLVRHIQRKRRGGRNFSIEYIFADLRKRLAGEFLFEKMVVPFVSSGFFRRMGILIYCFFRQEGICHITGDITFAAVAIGKRRLVVTVPDCRGVDQSSGIRRAFLRFFWLHVPVRRARIVTTISENAKERIVSLTGVASEKVVVIPVAINEQYVRAEKRFDETNPTILHIGTAPNKNLERLVPALAGLKCRLLVVGQLPEDILQLIDLHGIDMENFVGVSDAEMLELYHGCDILSLVSTYEGFGMPIVEANAVGRVVITSNVSSMTEVAGDAACLVNPLDVASIRSGFDRVIKDGGYRDGLIENGFRNCQRFDSESVAAGYAEVYRRMVS